MADFSTPFGNSSEKRLPTTTEKTNGFPCGPANQRLFNGLIHQLQSELNAIHQAGGVAGDDNVFNTTLLNIQALIDAATGSGDTSGYLLISQARARLPIFPEFLTTDGKINVTSPATGTIRIPAGIDFLHRGIFPVTTVQTDFTTDANKIYHIRWSPTNGYEMKDLAVPAYNPGTLAEDNVAFDSKYDDMLIARVVTNSSNVATITNLVNKDRLAGSFRLQGIPVGPSSNYGYDYEPTQALNWSRVPDMFFAEGYIFTGGAGPLERPGFTDDKEKSRYEISARVNANWRESHGTPPHSVFSVMHYDVGA